MSTWLTFSWGRFVLPSWPVCAHSPFPCTRLNAHTHFRVGMATGVALCSVPSTEGRSSFSSCWLVLSRCCSRWAYKISNTRFLKFLYITAWTQSSYSIGRAGAEVYNFSKYRWFLGEKQRVFKPSKLILKNIHLSGPWGRGFQRRWGLGEGLIDPFIYLIDNYAPDEGRESLVVVWNENMKVSSNFSFFRRNHHKPPPLNNLNKKCEIDYFNSDHKRDCGCNLIF